MAAAPILIGAGAVISAYGAIKSNSDRADAERQNANYFAEQAQYAQAVGDRELGVFEDKAASLRGQQIGAYAKGGVDLSGSPLLFLEQQSIRREQEARAIRDETARRVRLAGLKSEQSANQADNYSSFSTNFVSTAPTLLSAAGKIYKSGNGKKDFYNGNNEQWEDY